MTDVITTDVIVVGGGGAGLAAAIEARAHGRDVILIEKNQYLGGSTARSVGSITATNTPHQLRAGILDSVDDHFTDMGEFCARTNLPDNLALRRILVENVPDTFRWLQSLGVVFFGPNPEPPHRRPRMHNVLPNSKAYIYHLERHARRIGVKIVTRTRLHDFVLNEGRVVGIKTTGDRDVRYYARGGVVLATGDFGSNEEMRTRYISKAVGSAIPINPTNTGDGHQLVVALGGRMINPQHHIAGIRFDAPPKKLLLSLPPWPIISRTMAWSLDHLPSAILRPFVMSFLTTVLQTSPNLLKAGGILINREGRRFADEREMPMAAIPQQPDRLAYILLDGRLVEMFSCAPNHVSTAPGIAYAYLTDYRRSRKDVYRLAPTLDALAKKLGTNPETLQRTVADYNASIAADAPLARGNRPTIGQGPYVALGPVRYYITFSDSGVAVDDRHRVLGRGDEPIPGLYAAGFIGMGGMLLEGLGHHLGWAFTSGRRAGRFAASEVVNAARFALMVPTTPTAD